MCKLCRPEKDYTPSLDSENKLIASDSQYDSAIIWGTCVILIFWLIVFVWIGGVK